MGIWPYDGDGDWSSPFEEFIKKVGVVIFVIFIIMAFFGAILSALGSL